MKKLYISCPMRGRTEENIKKSFEKMHKIAEAVFNEKLEVIDPFIKNDPPDYFIGTKGYWKYPGGIVERDVADQYDIPKFSVDLEYAAPDVDEDEPMEEQDG